ncbi:hypothetical protein DYB25_004943 [Aphanomyces astaci]|uniref:GPR180/TMEM145 transmembrane domain-containing protein n=1 Tax=Aphanomyces astaci TaxID=112090 RepID=A0A397AUT3_APHAT|nr:hypothetical protein DYB25_004943 [Aphanomyces astaci]RHY45638.1 hypothetical protein DYB34_001719 [Aphanomyces astaci]RHY71085.1 hypothetical protein DYB30_007291 [Aphanomyces astaci]
MLLLFFVVATWMPAAHASVFAGFEIGREFSFLGKFCFTWDANYSHVVGEITAHIRTPDDGVKLAIYDDEDAFWAFISTDPSCDCTCKLADEHTKAVFDVPRASDASQTFSLNYTIREHLRPRFWYVALAKCVPGGDSYVPTLQSLTPANFQHYYLPLPVFQEGLTTVYTVSGVLSGLLVLIQLQSKLRLTQESFHPIVQLLTGLVALTFLTNASLGLHFYAFELNGIGAPLPLCLARIFQVINRVGMLLLAMLIAKGWTINAIALHGRTWLTTVMLTYSVLYLSLAVWYLGYVDPASTLYMYDSVPGLAICSLQIIVYAWFVQHLVATRAKEDDIAKRRFFLQMGVLFTVYILSLPVIVTVASVLSPWVREKIVESVTVSIDLATQAVLVYVLWPSRAPRYFDRLYTLVGSQAEKATLCDATLPSNLL